jgi:SAM-dependent methyltransferase
MGETMDVTVDPSNRAAADAWNGDDGAHWVAHAATYDRSVARYHGPFLDAAAIGDSDRVLDVGCGSGQTTCDAARRARGGTVVGVDLSAPLLELARSRAASDGIRNATFLQADAQVHPFGPASFDCVISRTGAMFFGDATTAFSNIARAVRPGGRLCLLVWQDLAANEWLAAFLGALTGGGAPPVAPPGAPGPFSLADPAHTHALLTGAGFTDVALADRREPMWFGADAGDAFAFVSSLGVARGILGGLDDAGRERALDALRTSIAAHDTADGVLYRSAAWIVTAVRR